MRRMVGLTEAAVIGITWNLSNHSGRSIFESWRLEKPRNHSRAQTKRSSTCVCAMMDVMRIAQLERWRSEVCACQIHGRPTQRPRPPPTSTNGLTASWPTEIRPPEDMEIGARDGIRKRN